MTPCLLDQYHPRRKTLKGSLIYFSVLSLGLYLKFIGASFLLVKPHEVSDSSALYWNAYPVEGERSKFKTCARSFVCFDDLKPFRFHPGGVWNTFDYLEMGHSRNCRNWIRRRIYVFWGENGMILLVFTSTNLTQDNQQLPSIYLRLIERSKLWWHFQQKMSIIKSWNDLFAGL